MDIVFLKPAELYVALSPTIISTVLGSCVAVTMYSRRTGLAAMCHAILPQCMEGECPDGQCSWRAKYLNCILPEMVKIFREKGVRPADIETGVFGGATVLSSLYVINVEQTVGWRNMRVGLSQLKELGIRVSVRNLGGTVGRKIQFETDSGRVVVKKHRGIMARK